MFHLVQSNASLIMFYPISTSGLNPNDIVKVVRNPNTGQSQEEWVPVSALVAPLNTPVIEFNEQPAPALTSGMQGYWPFDEIEGVRYNEFGESHFQEYTIDGQGVATVGSTPGRQSRGLAADFTGDPHRYLGVQLGEMGDDQVAVNFHCKASLPAEGTGVPIVCIAPSQDSRRPQLHRGGNFLCVGLEKVGAAYRFTAWAGYLFDGGTAWIDRVVSSVNISAATYYQVLVYTNVTFDASGNVSGRNLNISVNNTLDSAARTVFFNVDQPWLFVGDNPVLFGHQDRPVNLAVDNLSLWYGRPFTAVQREQLYSGGRGYDPTSSIIAKCLAFWELDEVTGNRADAHQGFYLLTEPVTEVGSAAGHLGVCASFENDDGQYLATQNFSLPPNGLSIAGFVRFVQTGAGIPQQAIIGWLSEEDEVGKDRGFRIFYQLDTGIVFEVGDGTNLMKAVGQDVVGGIVAATWYFVCCGVEPNGDMWISVNNAARTLGVTRAYPAQHWKLFMLGRDYKSPEIEALYGHMDCWGLYSPTLSVAEQDQIYTQISYPF